MFTIPSFRACPLRAGFDRDEPLFGVGGGVIVQGGPVFLDLGYRYKKIRAGESLQALITGDFSVNQVRFGLGVRF